MYIYLYINPVIFCNHSHNRPTSGRRNYSQNLAIKMTLPAFTAAPDFLSCASLKLTSKQTLIRSTVGLCGSAEQQKNAGALTKCRIYDKLSRIRRNNVKSYANDSIERSKCEVVMGQWLSVNGGESRPEIRRRSIKFIVGVGPRCLNEK